MHSIAPVRSAGGAADYFANDNYYTAEENAESGVWGGAAHPWVKPACKLTS